MNKYVIFDFDGTLVDSKDIFIPIFNEMAEKHRFKKVTEEDVEELRKLSIPERCKLLQVPLYKIPMLALEFYKLYQPSVQKLTLFDGISDVLKTLKQSGYEIVIVSSNAEEHIREFLRHNEIDFIHDVFCSNNIFGKDKVIKKFLKANKLQNSDVIYVGDELRDIVSCKKIGVEVIWVSWGYDVIETVQAESPNYIVNVPKEIVTVVHSK
ncbi:HAD-IB family phosphatase [Bacillus rhizoplanae]|uniref:HAD-IB family phosphatase n=1 Tax=Bacillus rhizoplanae TaxID=2880966 RepID=UPI003D24EDCA